MTIEPCWQLSVCSARDMAADAFYCSKPVVSQPIESGIVKMD